MKVRIKAYGIARDITGGTLDLEFDGQTVAHLRKSLYERYPALSGLASMMVAVNQQYAGNEVALHADDEIVLIPPVSGG
ncbi:MAG: MoaD/ThiS family protein [Cyclobacteriaceae bacterium]|nr:MoaD/ThiS family protein [Cyclobacteriaceae bacterium]